MKKVLFGCLLVLQALLATEASAGPCVSGSLASYVGLGAGGCTIGNFTFTGFTLQGLSEGGVAIDGISVNPVDMGGGLFGLDFTLNQSEVPSFVGIASVAAPAYTILESRVSFQITGTPTAKLTSSTVTLNGADTTGDGNVSTIQNLCIGGQFTDPNNDPNLCSPGSTPGAQNVVFITGVPELSSSTLMFLPTMTLAVMNDIVVDGGLAGSATLDSVSNRFTAAAAVPEPAPLLMIGAGLVLLFLRRRKSR